MDFPAMRNSSRTELVKSCHGAALVIVLACLCILAVLAVAFLVSIRTEVKSSRNYAEGMSSQLLAQSAYNLASNQIGEGSKGVDANNKLVAWASQPGMIRTYDTAGVPQKYFKLYSSDRMQGAGTIDLTSPDEQVSPTWFSDAALYTDLNQPLLVSGTLRYPIIDANGLKTGLRDTAGSNNIPGLAYDLDGDGKWDVEGFNVVAAPVASASSNPVPMPVKWLYVLQEGQVVAPTGGSGDTATFSGSNTPTASNPIVGRIAFWADDECCKININTASEGVYWDMPRIKSNTEDVLKMNQPVKGEYQRYPGHPAMTSLSTVVKPPPNFSTTAVPKCTYNFNLGKTFSLCSPSVWRDYLWAQKIYDIVPRIGTGGSSAGSLQTASLANPPGAPGVNLDADRLFGSVDEFIFSSSNSASGTRLLNDLTLTGSNSQSVLTKEALARDKFFLTANSRAPDLNFFGKPRVSMWPITVNQGGTAMMSPYDKLIAFCMTSGSNNYPYYFQRQDSNSPTADLPMTGSQTGLGRNRMLMEYLRSLAGEQIPGFGGSFKGKYGDDLDQILTEIFDYIRCTNLRDNSNPAGMYTPGIAGSQAGQPWANKIGIGQVVPIVDQVSNTRGFGRFPTIQGASVLFVGQVDGDDPLVPRDPSTHKSVPPYPASTSQIDLATGKPLPVYSGTGTSATVTNPAVSPGAMRVQAVLIPQFFTPSVGAPWIFPNFQFSIDTSNLTLSGPSGTTAIQFPANTGNYNTGVFTKNDTSLDLTGFGDQLGLRQGLRQGLRKGGIWDGALVSGTMDLPKGSYTLGGSLTIRIFAAAAVPSPAPSTTILQTIVLNFSGGPAFGIGGNGGLGLAYKRVANVNTGGSWDDATIHYLNYRSLSVGFSGPPASLPDYNPNDPDNPLQNATQGNRIRGAFFTRCAQGFIIPPDAVRSVRVASGDSRLVAAQTNPPQALFEANPTSDKLMGAHNFFTGFGQPYYGASLGRLAPGLDYLLGAGTWSGTNALNQQPSAESVAQPIAWVFGYSGFSPASDIPLNGVAVGKVSDFAAGDIGGDWDNAPFVIRDGPFINKADEGDAGWNGTNATSFMEPYSWNFSNSASGFLADSLFTPNRMIPSPAVLGSLPTGVQAGRPWQTLLFRPEPGHPGSRYKADGTLSAGAIPDHLFLDFFHMPVVEPYPISEPFSTAGRINMNYQIAPFTYINRDTGIRALLKSEKVISIPSSKVKTYKDYTQAGNATEIRADVDAAETLKGFINRFKTGANGNSPDLFHSPSEICELPIVPAGATYANLSTPGSSNYWVNYQLTGDNSKERIYATLYPRLTTRSNTFTIYARVQTLKKVPGTPPDVWREGKDQVTSEFRGYQTIERYLDPRDSRIVDYADPSQASSAKPLGTLYKTRVVGSKQFAP